MLGSVVDLIYQWHGEFLGPCGKSFWARSFTKCVGESGKKGMEEFLKGRAGLHLRLLSLLALRWLLGLLLPKTSTACP